jgi:hypothetical protein
MNGTCKSKRRHVIFQEDRIFIATGFAGLPPERSYAALSLRASSGGTASRPETGGEVSIILTLRRPELSGRDAEHLTEMTRQVALVGESYSIRNLGQ